MIRHYLLEKVNQGRRPDIENKVQDMIRAAVYKYRGHRVFIL